MLHSIDLNSDLGEGYGAWTMGDDAAMLDIVSSANVACGFHAGDPAGILATLRQAARRGVAVGAHVSYPDRVGFGRRAMQIDPDDLAADVIYQIGALQGMARAAGTRVAYVKPHGALYNTIASDLRQGDAVIAAIRAVEAQGASPKSFCAVNTGQALRHVPGFEGAPTGFSPLKLREWFLTLPGVTSKRHQDGDPANNHDVLLRQKDGSIEGYQNGHLIRRPGA